jgi:ribosomal protein S24E
VDAAIAVVFLTCVANLLLGLFILLRNPNSRVGQSFFLMTVLISAWALSNYLTDNASILPRNILFNRLAYLFAFLALISSAYFTYYFLGRKGEYSSLIKFSIYFWIIGMGLLSVTDLVAGTVSESNGQLIFKTGPLILIYLVEILVAFAVIVRNLYIVIKQGSPSQRNQARIIIALFSGCVSLAVVTNLIIPVLTNNYSAAKYGPPLLTLFMTVTITYAIVAKRLFDIRLVAARSVGYVLLLGVLGAAYFISTFTLGGFLFSENASIVSRELYYTCLSLLLAFLFQPIRRSFQRITDSIFYKDYYDPQSLLNSLGAILAREIEMQRLTDGVLKELVQQMKIDKASIVVLDNDEIFFEANSAQVGHKYMSKVSLQQIEQGLIIRDLLDGQKDTPKLYKEYDIQVSIGLKSNNELYANSEF